MSAAKDVLPRSQVWLLALITANVVMALGPWLVRLADCGPVSSAFWRVLLPLPLFAALARREAEPTRAMPWRVWLPVALGGVMFGLDLAFWHLGIVRTRLGNAALFGNSGSVILMLWGMVAARRRPRLAEAAAALAAAVGAAIILGRSFEINARTLAGDLLCIAAGLAYVGYLLLLRHSRGQFGPAVLLTGSALTTLPVLLVTAWGLGEPIWPHDWRPLVALALGSQVIGQLLLVGALRHVRPLVVGITLLTQPGIALLAGWFAFGETIGWLDGIGIGLMSAALVLARAADQD